MEELLQRLAALDPAAEDAARAIVYFDRLMERRAGLDSFVRAAAILSGCPAGLHDPDRHITVRIHPDGHRLNAAPYSDPWPAAALGGSSRVWLERDAATLPTDRIILERLAVGVGVVLDRTRGNTPGHDPASVEALLSPETGVAARQQAMRRLSLPPDLRIRAVAALPETATTSPNIFGRWLTRIGRVHAAIIPADAMPADVAPTDSMAHIGSTPTGFASADSWPADAGFSPTGSVLTGTPASHAPGSAGLPPELRAGIGPAVTAAELPVSWAGALDALRLTAAAGPRLLRHDDLGGLALLAERVSAEEALIDDVRAVRAARDQMPDALETLAALADTDSLRRAAAALFVHHSTLQSRLPRLTAVLGYRPDTPAGRQRLHLALALHRINLNGPLP
ncbi:PucR family transcriptional regulator [Nocardia sp. NPDC088792]|uniref:PucR family transcriptional regulator n=1 Tax=Nocardia sp. NPDC088792 TaxID=3364332 RepID=UPI00381E3A5C